MLTTPILAEWRISLVMVTESYFVRDRPNWHGDRNGSVAVIGEASMTILPPRLIARGKGYVAVDWREPK